jgi:hypothetical protein
MMRRILVAVLLLVALHVPVAEPAGAKAAPAKPAAQPRCDVPVAAALAAATAAKCDRTVEVAQSRPGVREFVKPDGVRRLELAMTDTTAATSGGFGTLGFHGVNASRWAYATNNNSSNSDLSTARVGRSPDSGVIYRSFFEFPIGAVAGTHIISATFSINLQHSWSCASTVVTAWRSNPIASTPRTPSGTWPFQAYLSTQAAHANKADCPTPDTPLMSFPATGDVQAVADAAWSAYTVGLSAHDSNAAGENTESRWKKFIPSTAKLVIEYNRPPAAPTDLTVDQAAVCGSEPFSLNTTNGVRLRANLSDPDGDGLRAQWRLSGVDPQYAPPDSAPAVGGPVSTLVPAAAFTEGRTYTWSVRGNDGKDAGPWSADCSFTVNNRIPEQPVVTSTELALGTSTIPPAPPSTAIRGRNAVVRLAPAAGDGDVVGYRYALGAGVAQPPSVWAPVAPGGAVEVPMPPVSTGLEPNILTVRAVDQAGQEGTTATYRFRAQESSANARTTGDVTGDGRGDVLQVRDVGGALTAWIAPLTMGLDRVFPAVRVFDGGNAYRTATSLWADGDVDGDRRTDLVVVRRPAGGRVEVSVLGSTGLSLLAQPPVWDSGAAGWDLATLQVAADDVDADGLDDVLLARPDGVQVMLGTPDGPAAPVPWMTGAVEGRVRTGDLTGDGRADLLRYAAGDVWVHASTGGGFDAATRWWDGSATDLAAVVTGDFDGTGADDLAVLSGTGVRALLSDGTAVRAAATQPLSSDAARSKLGGSDLDGDGMDDVVAMVDDGDARPVTRMFRSTGAAFEAPRAIGDGGPEWAAVGFGVTGVTPNLTTGATATASTGTPESSGWAPRFAIDGRRDSTVTGGWSSASTDPLPHTEWLEVSFPSARTINRVDLYPRKDATSESGRYFPTSSVQVWTGTAWESAASVPRSAGPATSRITTSFPARTTTKLRWSADAITKMQLAEIEAYLVE